MTAYKAGLSHKKNIMKKLLTVLLTATISIFAVSAQKITPYKGTVEGGYNFWLSSPASNDTATPKPLVIFLHGSSLCGTDLNRVMRYGTMAAVKKG